MAAAVDKSQMHVEFGRIPVIDMQHFSQDEINTAAQSSDAYRFDDVVIPNIDYSMFNESTGSSNQTYSNQLLLQSKDELADLTRRRAGHLSSSRQRNVLNENEKKEIRWVLELIKESRIKGDNSYKSPLALNIPLLNTAIGVHNLPVDQQNTNLEAHNSLQLSVRDPALQTVDDAILANSALNTDGSMPIADTGLDRAKKRIRTKEGARRKPFMNCNETVDDPMFLKTAGSNADNTAYLTHGFNKVHGSNDGKAAKDDIDAPVNNVGSNIVSPRISNEPMVPQFKRKVKPLATEAELQEFFNNIGGEWASNMKRRKIVDAEDFAEGFPKGWKLLLGVRKKHGKFIIECRKYMSPDGLQFASCREVTTHLSNAGNSPVGVVTAQETPCHAGPSDDHQNALAATSVEENIMKESQVIAPAGGAMLTGVLSTGNNAEAHSLEFDSSAVPGIETLNKIWQRDNSSGTLDIAGNSKKRHNPASQNYPMNCKKCNGTFSNRSAFMGHLSMHHVKKKKVVADKTITDGAILTDGKYECQICHKVFDERNRYTGHVGVHSRKNVKRPRDALDQTGIETKAGLDEKEISDFTGPGDGRVRAKQIVKRPRVSLDQTGTESKADLNSKKTSDDKQELQIKAEHNQDILEAKVKKEQSSAENSYLAYLGAEGNGLASSSIGGFLGGLDSDSGKDRESFSAGNEKFDTISDFEKIHMYTSAPKFSSFETCQDAIDAEFGDVLQQVESPSEQFMWDSYLPGRENNSSQFSICLWCNEEFIPDGIDQDQQDDSVQKTCPNCKTKSEPD